MLVGVESAFLGVFCAVRGRGKRADRSPVHAHAASTLQVHLGWTVQTWDATEALACRSTRSEVAAALASSASRRGDRFGDWAPAVAIHVPMVLFWCGSQPHAAGGRAGAAVSRNVQGLIGSIGSTGFSPLGSDRFEGS